MGLLSKNVLQWEPLVRQFAGKIPVKFGLTIIAHESAGDPDAVSNTGARGLMQITGVALKAVNRALGTSYVRADLFDPKVNVMVGMGLLNSIVQTWDYKHPKTLSARWTSAQWLALLVLAWNAGSFEHNGVGYVVTSMERGNIPRSKITVDTVAQASANLPNASKWMRVPQRVAWAKKVARDYLRVAEPRLPPAEKSGSRRWPWLLIGGAAVGGAAYLLLRPGKSGGSITLSSDQIGLLKGLGG